MEETTKIRMESKAEAAVRAEVYDTITDALAANGMATEPVKGGRLVDLGNGFFGRVQFSICDTEKVDGYRTEYAEQVQKNAARDLDRIAKAAEKAEKTAAREAAKAAKAATK